MNLQAVLQQGVAYQVATVKNDKELVQDIQRNLIRLGFNPGKVDGDWGPRTQNAFNILRASYKIASPDLTPAVAKLLLQPKPTPAAASRPAPAPAPARPPAPAPAPAPRPASPAATAVRTATKRRINVEGLKLVKNFEGLRLESYRCPAGVATIGYGSTAGVKMGQKITPQQAEALLIRDLERFESAVSSLVKVPITDNQFAALVAFAFNVGTGALKQSTLLKLLNQRNYQGAADQLLRWDKAGGRVLAGLQRRRQAERALFLKR